MGSVVPGGIGIPWDPLGYGHHFLRDTVSYGTATTSRDTRPPHPPPRRIQNTAGYGPIPIEQGPPTFGTGHPIPRDTDPYETAPSPRNTHPEGYNTSQKGQHSHETQPFPPEHGTPHGTVLPMGHGIRDMELPGCGTLDAGHGIRDMEPRGARGTEHGSSGTRDEGYGTWNPTGHGFTGTRDSGYRTPGHGIRDMEPSGHWIWNPLRYGTWNP